MKFMELQEVLEKSGDCSVIQCPKDMVFMCRGAKG